MYNVGSTPTSPAIKSHTAILNKFMKTLKTRFDKINYSKF
jgi:hypothetical protein